MPPQPAPAMVMPQPMAAPKSHTALIAIGTGIVCLIIGAIGGYVVRDMMLTINTSEPIIEYAAPTDTTEPEATLDTSAEVKTNPF